MNAIKIRKRMNAVRALILTVCMIVALLPTNAYAASTFTTTFKCGSKSYKATKEVQNTYVFLLSDVLTALDIEGTVTDVSIPEELGISAEKRNGVWYLVETNVVFTGNMTVTYDDSTTKTITVSASPDSISVAFYSMLTFNSAGGTGTLTTVSDGKTYTDAMRCRQGYTYTLPECPYEYEGYTFAGWEIKGVIYQPGDDYYHTGSTTAKTLWQDSEGNIINQAEVVSITTDPNVLHGTFSYPEEVRVGQNISIEPVADTGYHIYSVSVNGRKISPSNGKYSYTMTATPAVVAGVFQKSLAGGTEANPVLLDDDQVYFLTGGWYKVSGTISFPHEIIFTSDVTLVLEDGCNMTVSGGSGQDGFHSINGTSGSEGISIYGDTGKLTVQTQGTNSIATGYFNLYGGNVSLNKPLYSYRDICISGGTLSSSKKLYSYQGDVNISGGSLTCTGSGEMIQSDYKKVNITGGIINSQYGTIAGGYVNVVSGQVRTSKIAYTYGLILGCSEPDDYIKASTIAASRTSATAKIADGVILVDGEENTYKGALTNDAAAALGGKTLKYLEDYDAEFKITINSHIFGSVTAEQLTASYGDTIQLSTNPKTGFKVKSIKCNGIEIMPDAQGNYSFEMPRTDVTIVPDFEKKTFTVTWMNYDGTVLETDENVEYGSAPFYDGEEPVRESTIVTEYQFVGWDKEYSAVTDDVTYTAQYEETELDLTLQYSHTLTLQNNLSINYYITAALLEGFENVKLCVEKDTYDKNDNYTVTTDVLDGELVESQYGTEYKFRYTGIASYEIGNEIRAYVIAELDGESYTFNVDTYSIATYCYNQMKKSTSTDKLKTLIVDLLNYGSMSQSYFGIRTDKLVNSDLTEEQIAYGSTECNPLSSSDAKTVLNGATATISKTLVLGNNVELKVYMTLPAETDKSQVALRISYTNMNGKKVTKNIPFDEFEYNAKSDEYSCRYDGIMAPEFRNVLSIAVYDNGTRISDLHKYSIETYAYNRINSSTSTELMKDLVKAMMTYSDSAAAYFNK